MINTPSIYDPPDQSDYEANTWNNVLLWSVNIIFLSFGLCRLLLYGDPILPAGSKVFVEVNRKRCQAEFNISKNDYEEAYHDLSQCLQYFSRRLPFTRRGIFLASLWEALRQLLHRLYVSRLVTYVGKKFANKSKRRRAEITAREMALVYQQILCLKLAQGKSARRNSLLYIALSAVNYAEASGDSMPLSILAEIYVNAALCFKKSVFPLVHRYYLNKARGVLLLCSPPQKLKWLTNDDGARFLVKQRWNYGPKAESDFTAQNTKSEPLSYAARAYREHLITQGLRMLAGTINDAHATALLDISRKVMTSARAELCARGCGDDSGALNNSSYLSMPTIQTNNY